MIFKLLAILFASFAGFSAFADNYYYAGVIFSCEVGVDRQEIGVGVREIGEFRKLHVTQLFKSEVLNPRITSHLSGDGTAILDMLNAGGIPNLKASDNFTVMSNSTSIRTYLDIPGNVRMPLDISIANLEGSQILATLGVGLYGLDVAQKILKAFGDVNTPDFQTDKPIVTWSNTSGYVNAYASGVQWQQSPNNIHTGAGGSSGQQVLQIHYPPDRHNGLSYHIAISCYSTNR